MQDAAESNLSGDVSPATSGGIIRYRIWPARRHPLRTVLCTAFTAVATWATGYTLGSFFWAAFVLGGLVLSLAIFFFPTEVTLDGDTLHIRHLGTPRTWSLGEFRRVQVGGEPLPRVELAPGTRASARDTLRTVTLPLPADTESCRLIVAQIRRFIGRAPSGPHEIEADMAPEDDL